MMGADFLTNANLENINAIARMLNILLNKQNNKHMFCQDQNQVIFPLTHALSPLGRGNRGSRCYNYSKEIIH
jgi:hypothetical protein